MSDATHTTVIAVDPGNKQSAIVHYDPLTKAVIESLYAGNALVLRWLYDRCDRDGGVSTLLIEMIASYGMPVGKEVFETCVWIGRFVETWSGPTQLIYRRDVKLHLCGSARANDGNIRQSLLDKFGGERACGTKKARGALYGITGDKWAALAVAVTWAETEMIK